MKQSHYRLVALDLDDTLLNSNNRISQTNIDAVRKATESGVIVTIATGRGYGASLKHLEALGINGTVINYGGAQLTRCPGGRIIKTQGLSGELAGEVLAMARELGEYVQIYENDVVYFEKSCKWSQYYLENFMKAGREAPDIFEREWLNSPKIIVAAETARAQELVELFKAHFGPALSVARSKPMFVEITNPLATKGNALKVVIDGLGIPQSEVVAIGDNTIDISMLKLAGLGICMQNGAQELKAVADVIAPSNDEDGVAWAINKYILCSE